MESLIIAKTGSEQHSSNWGKFAVHGLELVADGFTRDRHEYYRDGSVLVVSGKIFSVWNASGDKHGTEKNDYYICITDLSTVMKLSGGCYRDSAHIEGPFRILAHGDGKVRAPRLLEWVKKLGGIEKITPDIAAQLEEQIHARGHKDFIPSEIK